MKLLRSLSILFLCIQLSCKNDNKPDNPTPPIADTLSAGWSRVKVVPEVLEDIFFYSNTKGYTVSNTRIMKTIDGGSTWTTADANYTRLVNLSVTADGKVFVAGNSGSIIKSLNEGLTFSSYQFAGATNVTDVFFTNNTTGYTLANGQFFRTTDAGTTWNQIATITGGNFQGPYTSLYILDDMHGWLTLESTIYRSNGSLNNWVKGNLSVPTQVRQTMSVFPVSATTVFVGEVTGKIMKSDDGGANFYVCATLIPGTQNGYLDLHFISPALGYASFLNKIYKTTDGGNTWTVVAAVGSDYISEIHFTDANHGWASTDKGNVIKYAL